MNDPKLFRELSEPFPDADSSNKAMQAFFYDLYAIRKKHRILNVMCVVSGSSIYGDAKDENSGEGEWLQLSMVGDRSRAVGLAAYALGYYQAENRELTNRILMDAGSDKQLGRRERGK